MTSPRQDTATTTPDEPGRIDTELATKTDPRLTQAQREALLGVYRIAEH